MFVLLLLGCVWFFVCVWVCLFVVFVFCFCVFFVFFIFIFFIFFLFYFFFWGGGCCYYCCFGFGAFEGLFWVGFFLFFLILLVFLGLLLLVFLGGCVCFCSRAVSEVTIGWLDHVVFNVEGFNTGFGGTVAMSSANGLVGTGFASRYRLLPRAGFLKAQIGRCKATTLSSLSLTSNRVTTNH